ncbi:hypothetical protein QL285_050222 [Trifolium repens]|nr:hypothetical protein QL285_050222 [Trifolium repens]
MHNKKGLGWRRERMVFKSLPISSCLAITVAIYLGLKNFLLFPLSSQFFLNFCLESLQSRILNNLFVDKQLTKLKTELQVHTHIYHCLES